MYFYYLVGQGLDELGQLIGKDNLKDKAVLVNDTRFLFSSCISYDNTRSPE
jgi:hypothetical protein